MRLSCIYTAGALAPPHPHAFSFFTKSRSDEGGGFYLIPLKARSITYCTAFSVSVFTIGLLIAFKSVFPPPTYLNC